MTPTDLECFGDSLSHCHATPRFLERRYELILETSPEARVAAGNAPPNLLAR